MKKNILLTGGGTAGHVMPCVAILPELKKKFDKIYYIGRENSVEERIAKQYNIQFLNAEGCPFDRTHFINNFKLPIKLKKSAYTAAKEIMDKDISVVFSKGGYASVPAMLAARKLKIPIVVHESDLSFGMANKFGKSLGATALTSFPQTKGGLYVGNPIRREIFEGKGEIIANKFKKEKPILLILGGSSGAQALNDFAIKNKEILTKDYNVILIAGKNGVEKQTDSFVIIKYALNIWDYYAAADIVISRCGANSAYELAALSKRVVFVPLSGAHTRGDQVENALYFSKFKNMVLLNQDSLTIDKLYKKIEETKLDRPRFNYPTNVNKRIVDVLVKVANGETVSVNRIGN